MQQPSEASVLLVPGGDRAASLIAVIWSFVVARKVWPTYAEVDNELYRGGVGIEDARSELMPGLVVGLESRGLMPPADDQRLQLSIGGVATCDATGDHVGTFMLVVRFVVMLEKDWDYEASREPRFTFDRVREQVPLRGADGLTVLRRVLSVIDAEPWSGGYGGEGDDRIYCVTRRIRKFAGAKTFSDYWEVRDRLANPGSENLPPTFVPKQGSMPESDTDLAEVGELRLKTHPLLQSAMWLYDNGRMAEAAESATREVEARLVALSGEAGRLPDTETFGQRRIAAALSPSSGPLLNVCRADDGYDRGEQEGLRLGLMGFYSGLRNPIGHRKYRPTDPDEVAEILAKAGFWLRRLDVAEARRSGDR